MKKLVLGNFKREGAQGSFDHYFSFKDNNIEICLEACMGGYCIAMYDKAQNLLKPKVCTNIDMSIGQLMPGFSVMTGEALVKAVEIANELFNSQK
jgi:hypothetical protein